MKNKYFIFYEQNCNGSHTFKAYSKGGELIEKITYYFETKRNAKKLFLNTINFK